eukprot:9485088-Pyramimonas_sp.AAC.1
MSGEGWGCGCAEESDTNLGRGRLYHSTRGRSLTKPITMCNKRPMVDQWCACTRLTATSR